MLRNLIFLSLISQCMLWGNDERVVVGERQLPPEEQQEIQEERSKEGEGEPRGIAFVSDHPGAFHRPLAVAIDGSSVEIEDGSVWSIRYSQSYKAMNWLNTDNLVITQNTRWFSNWQYRIHNLDTGVHVDANLALAPYLNGAFTHWIVAIDYQNRELWLEDGSRWKVSFRDRGTFKRWIIEDTVILGINAGWFSFLNRNILINVNMDNYVRAEGM